MSDHTKNKNQLMKELNDIKAKVVELENKLAEEKQFRQLVEITSDWIWQVDKNGICTYVSENIEKVLGYKPNEIIGKTPFDFATPSDAARISKLFKEYSKKAAPFDQLVNSEIHKNGEIVYVETSGVPVFDSKGKLIGFKGINRDITEKITAEKKIKESEIRFRTLFETMAQGVVYQDVSGMIISANSAAENILGLTKDQLFGRTSMDPRWHTIHEDGSPFPGEQHPSMMALQSGKKITDVVMGVFNPTNETYKWILVNAIPLFEEGEDNPYQVYTTFNDISDIRKTAKALKESEEKFRNIIESSPMGIHMYKLEDDQLIFSGANPSADSILGVDHSQFIGKTIEEAFPPLADTEIPDSYRMACLTGKNYYTENIDYEDEKIRGAFEVYAFQTAPNIMAALFLDITERKKMEQALVKSEQKYRNLYKTALVGLFQTSMKDGQVIAANQVAATIFGYDSVDQFKAEFKTSEHYANSEERKKMVETALKTGRIEHLEILGTKRDGSLIPLDISLAAYENEGIFEGVIIDISERKRAEEALRESEEKYRLVVENANEAITVAQDGRLKFFNSRMSEMVGYSHDEIFEKPFLDLIHPDDREMVGKRHIGRLKGEDLPSIYSFRVITKSNEMLWVEINVVKITWENQPATLNFLTDITERKEAEQALKNSETRFRTVSQLTSDYAYSFKVNTDLSLENEWIAGALKKITGFTKEEIEKKGGWESLIFTDDMHIPLKQLEKLLAGKSTVVEYRIVDKKGELRWMLDYAQAEFNNEKKRIVRILGAVQDITERKQAEEALNESRKMLRLVLDTIPVRVFWRDKDFKYLGCNLEFAKDAGFESPNELIGKSDYDLVWKDSAESHLQDDVDIIQTGNEKLNLEESVIGPNNKFWIRISKVPLRDRDNKIVGVLGTYEEITEQKSLEDQFRQAQKMEAVGRLAGGVAHDFNNVLTAIKGYSQLILNELTEGDAFYQDVSEINMAANRAAELTKQLLLFSRKQVIQPQVFGLNTCVKDMDKMLQRLIGEDIIFETSFQAKWSSIKADRSQIEQVIMNLVINARDATPTGGKIRIETSNETFDKGTPTVDVSMSGTYVLLSVSDTGMGMTKETQQHLFEPFFTTKEIGRGTGLGLATVYGIINQSDGFIRVESEINKGTKFKIYLLLVEDEIESEIQTDLESDNEPGSETILIVEDEDIVRELAVKILERNGYHVISTQHVDDAISIVNKYKNTIHLLLTDVVMPKMNGAELANRLTSVKSEMKVLFISGYTDEAIIHHGVLDGEVNFLQKPFTPNGLIKKIRQILDV